MGKRVEDVNTYRLGHPLAQKILTYCKALNPPPGEVIFEYSASGKKITSLDPLVTQRGWLSCECFTFAAFEVEDHLVFAGLTDDGEILDSGQCRRLFDLPASCKALPASRRPAVSELGECLDAQRKSIAEQIQNKNGVYFDSEMDKLDRWADDRRNSLKTVLAELDDAIKLMKKDARLAPNLPTKLDLQRKLRQLENKRNEAWKDFDESSREIDHQKDSLLDEISARLEQKNERRELFTIRWQVV